MSSDRRPWYPWYPRDFNQDEKVKCLSDDAELLYRRALDVMWQATALQLPSNCLKLALALARGWTTERFEKAWSEVQTPGYELFKTTENGDFIYSERLSREADKIKRLSEIRSIQGSKAKAKQLPSNCQAKGKQKPNHTDTDTDSIYTCDFETFWAEYPNKKSGKANTFKSWKKCNGHRPDIDRLISIIRQQKKSTDWMKENGQFIPMATTWLNQRRWDAVMEIENKQPVNTGYDPSRHQAVFND